MLKKMRANAPTKGGFMSVRQYQLTSYSPVYLVDENDNGIYDDGDYLFRVDASDVPSRQKISNRFFEDNFFVKSEDLVGRRLGDIALFCSSAEEAYRYAQVRDGYNARLYAGYAKQELKRMHLRDREKSMHDIHQNIHHILKANGGSDTLDPRLGTLSKVVGAVGLGVLLMVAAGGAASE